MDKSEVEMVVLIIHEDGSRRIVTGHTWNDISLQMSCSDISATVISDVDFPILTKDVYQTIKIASS